MKIVHLIQYHLGGGRKRKGGKGGHTPTPQLPDAGKPYVDSVSYDKDAKKVRLRAQNARAGEVKTPLGDWQEFPVDVPEPTPLPDAGKPFVEGVTYDPDTKKVKVRAKVAQAGEVKDPIGEEQEFPIHVPTPPAPPAPTLPDAGKPRVSKFDYDPATRKVTVQASVAQAGEVKTPLGDEQTFDIPAEATPPAAGLKGYFYRFLVDDEARSGDSISGTVETDLGQVRSKHGETKTIETKKYPLTPGTTNAYKLQIDCLSDYTYRILPEDSFTVEDGYLCITQRVKFIDAYGTGPASEAWCTNTYPVN